MGPPWDESGPGQLLHSCIVASPDWAEHTCQLAGCERTRCLTSANPNAAPTTHPNTNCSGTAMLGVGVSSGKNRAEEAALVSCHPAMLAGCHVSRVGGWEWRGGKNRAEEAALVS